MPVVRSAAAQAPACIMLVLVAGLAASTAHGQDSDAAWPRIWEGIEQRAPDRGRPIAEDQVFLHSPYRQGWQNHSYTWIGRLENGTLLNISPFQWRYGILGHWGLYVVLVDPDGRVFSYDGQLGEGSVVAAATGMRLRAGSCSFETDGSVHRWRIAVPGFSCDLAFANVLPAWMPGDGMAHYVPGGQYYYQYALPAPWADVTGTVSVFGRTVSAEGQCLYDTAEIVLPLTRTNEEIVAFRAFSPPGTPRSDRWFVSLLRIGSHRGFGPLVFPLLLVAHGDAWILTCRDFAFSVEQAAGVPDLPYTYATSIAVSGHRGSAAVAGAFTVDRLFHVMDVLDRLPSWIRVLVSWFVRRPVVYRSVARFTGTAILPDGSEHRLDLLGQGEHLLSR